MMKKKSIDTPSGRTLFIGFVGQWHLHPFRLRRRRCLRHV
jgi:hypothetical protein